MFASTVFPAAMSRVSSVALALLQKFLMVAGLVPRRLALAARAMRQLMLNPVDPKAQLFI